MEDSERQLYFGLINQLIQYNMSLTGQLMSLAMNKLSPQVPPMPMSFGIPSANLEDINKLSQSWQELPLPGEFMKDMMDAFLSKKDKQTKE